MIYITPEISLDEKEIEYKFIRSSGPGGQHVNKASTGVQLRFNIPYSSLGDEIKHRLQKNCRNRINSEGTLIITAQNHRSQDLNKKQALHKLIELIIYSSIRRKKRKKTKPSRASVQRRLDNKKHTSMIKKHRRKSGLN